MSNAWACRITEENFPAIASEKPNFNREEIERWLTEFRSGWFIRDETQIWDCHYMPDEVFRQAYIFDGLDDGIFRRIIRV